MPDPVPSAVAAQPEPAGDSISEYARQRRKPQQANLFGGQKVVPFEALVSTRRQYGRRRDATRTQTQTRVAVRPAQAALELHPAPPPALRIAAYRDARVADMGLRARAAALDAMFCLAGVGVFAATFHFMGGTFTMSRAALPGWIGAVLLVAASYHLAFALAGRNTAGMACCRAAVVSFDGLPPGPKKRLARLFWAAICTAAGGLGPAWALFDDERLAWHDHITKTFPTILAPPGAQQGG